MKTTLVVPSEMAESCNVPLNSPSVARVPKVHLTLGEDHPVFGKNPWTQQTQGCGKPGDFLYVPSSFLKVSPSKEKAKVLVQEWAKFRWGVFEEYGMKGDPVYSLSYATDFSLENGTQWVPNYCVNNPLNGKFLSGCQHPNCPFVLSPAQLATSSLLALPSVENITRFCDINSHDRTNPTKHNAICEGKSVLEIYEKHPDSSHAPLSPGGYVPVEYTILEKNSTTQFVVLIDETKTMAEVMGRWETLMSAAKHWIMEDVLNGSEVGIVTFDNLQSTKLSPSLVDGSNRVTIASYLPSAPRAESSSKSIKDALNYVKTLSQDGATVIMIVDPQNFVDSEIDVINAAGSNIVWPLLFPVTEKTGLSYISKLQNLSSATGGKMLMIKNKVFNSTFFDLKQSISVQQIGAQHMRKVQENAIFSVPSIVPFQVMEQELVSMESTFSFYVGDNIDLSQPMILYMYSHSTPSRVQLNAKTPVNLTVQDVTATSYKALISNLQRGQHNITIKFQRHIESHWVEILAMEVEDSVSAKVWSSHNLTYAALDASSEPVVLFTKLTSRNLPVVGAKVLLTVESEGKSDTIVLKDNGGGPDITGNDGVYSAYWTVAPNGVGIYNIFLELKSTDNMKTIGSLLGNTEGVICCGSSINLDLISSTRVTASFNQKIGTSFVRSEAGKSADIFPPARVTDLRGFVDSNGVNLTFTAPGDDLDRGFALKYVVWWWDATTLRWSEISSVTYTIVEGGSLASVLFSAPACDHLLQYRVTARDTRLNEGALSNIVNIIYPCNKGNSKLPIGESCPSHGGAIAGAFFGGLFLGLLIFVGFLLYQKKKRGSGASSSRSAARTPNTLEMSEGRSNGGQGHTNRGFVAGVQNIYGRRPRLHKSDSKDIKRQNKNRDVPAPPNNYPATAGPVHGEDPNTFYGDPTNLESPEYVYETVAMPTNYNESSQI